MKLELSFLPVFESRSACEHCVFKSCCSDETYNEIEDYYCRKRRFAEVTFEGFEWNQHGVCVNAESVVVKTGNKKLRGSVLLAQFLDGQWRYGIQYNNDLPGHQSRGGSYYPGLSCKGYPDRETALMIGTENVLSSLGLGFKNDLIPLGDK